MSKHQIYPSLLCLEILVLDSVKHLSLVRGYLCQALSVEGTGGGGGLQRKRLLFRVPAPFFLQSVAYSFLAYRLLPWQWCANSPTSSFCTHSSRRFPVRQPSLHHLSERLCLLLDHMDESQPWWWGRVPLPSLFLSCTLSLSPVSNDCSVYLIPVFLKVPFILLSRSYPLTS